MASKNRFDFTLAKVREDLGVPPTLINAAKGKDIGVEIELEGSLATPNHSEYWSVHPEGSLRDGGFEYVLTNPLPIGKLQAALTEFDEAMKISKPVRSIRTSTHIHINVLDLTLREIYNVMAAYYLLEEMFVNTQSENRRANLFCLTMARAEDIFASIIDSLEGVYPDYVSSFHVERNRYAAMNLCALVKYGSLEFRFMDAMVKGVDIQAWCKTFYNLVHTAKKMTPRQLLDTYDALSAKDFVSTLLTPELALPFFEKFTRSQITAFLHTNYDYVFELCEALGRKRFQMPSKFWKDDLESGLMAYTIAEGGFTTMNAGAIFDALVQQETQNNPWQTLAGTNPGPVTVIDDFEDGPFPPAPSWGDAADPDDDQF